MKYPVQSDLWKLEHASKNKLNGSKNSSDSFVLARARQFFPFTLFCDELIIEEHRVVWIDNKGPWTKEYISIMATDIASVNSSTGPVFGHIHIKSLTGGPEILVDRLFKREISKIRDIIEGIVMASRNGVHIQEDNIETKRQIFLRAGTIT